MLSGWLNLNTVCTLQRLASRKTEHLKRAHVEQTHIQTDKKSPSTELDKYLVLEMCKEAAEGVWMQCEKIPPRKRMKPESCTIVHND